jgi:hypothetical protein
MEVQKNIQNLESVHTNNGDCDFSLYVVLPNNQASSKPLKVVIDQLSFYLAHAFNCFASSLILSSTPK